MTMSYISDPGFDGSVADRLKRRIFNAGLDPSAPSAVDLPIRTYDIPPVSDQGLRDIGNATVGVEPRPSFVQRLLGGLQSVARDPRTANVAAGLASVFRPTDSGAQGFLGSAADAFLNASQYTNQRGQQQREQQLKDRLTQAQIHNLDSEASNRGVNGYNLSLEYINDPTNPNQQLGVNRDPRTGAMRPAVDFQGRPVVRSKAERPEAIPEWQRQGYTSFEAWRADHQQPSEGERRAAGLLSGAREAFGDVDMAVRQGFSPNAEPAISQALGTLFNNTTWRNATASPLGQRYYTAVERLFTNYLYTVSGAQVPPAEIANQARQATVAFFDAKGTREQKMASLRGKLHEMEIMAGRDLSAVGLSGNQSADHTDYTPPP